ncbi:MAG: CPBP family intramembrane metalloprotease [Bacteroidetes bacterium]|nr:CPBP family intramembrane metalloprotease [Bacteroidota bacterium]
MMIKIIFVDFLKFLINPNSQRIKLKSENALYIKKILITICITIVSVITGLFLFVLSNLILTKLNIVPPDVVNHGKVLAIETFSIYQIFFLSAILAPIIEEIIFRLPLIFNNLYLALSISSFYLLLKLLAKVDFYMGNYDFEYIITHTVIGVSLFIVTLLILKIKWVKNTLLNIYKNKFGLLFYSIAVVFGIIHYPGELSLYMFSLTIPQTIAGIFNGYVRLKFGFQYAVLMHLITNSFCFLM